MIDKNALKKHETITEKFNANSSLKELLLAYCDQSEIRDQFLSFLESVKQPYHREEQTGHITASICLLNREQSCILLMHHKKLNMWLQPGGHCDGDDNVLRVGLKEGLEETGIEGIMPLSTAIFDLDIHVIPTHKEILGHVHYDVRFLCKTTESDLILKNEESHEVAWFPLEAQYDYVLNLDNSVKRLIKKAKIHLNLLKNS